MIGLDSNDLIRYLVQDEPQQSAIATRLIESELSLDRAGHVSLVALAETIGVLQGRYGVDKADIAPVLATLATDERFSVQDAGALWLALESCEQTEADLSDALIVHLNQTRGCTHTLTFDEHATRLSGMSLLT